MKNTKQLKKNLSNKKRNKEKLLITNDKGYAYYRFSYEKKRRKISLGKYGSPESETNYYLFKAEFAQNPIAAIEKWSSRRNKPTTTPTEQSITLEKLVEKYTIAKQDSRDKDHYRRAGQLLIDRLGANFPAATITSDNMFDIRDYFNDLPSQKDDRLPSRQYVNKVIGYIKAIFRWGVKKRLIRQAEVLSVMDAIKPIESGEGNRETIDRREISDEVVNQMIPYLTPQLHAMIQTQGMYGFRPSEVCNMKVRDFDFTHYQEKDGYVIYLLKEHKTARYGESFEYFFYKRIMDLIFPYLKGKKPDDYVFPPKQHLQELRERAAAKRKSKITPSQLWRKAVAAKNPKEIINDHWEENNYNRAVSNAIKAANKELPQDEQISHFTVYQLRYGFVSRTSETDGTDRAQTCVGHKTNIMTRHYDKSRPNVCKKHFKDLPLPFAIDESESVKTESTKSEESESEKSESINAA